MKASATTKGITLRLTDAEALDLVAFIGQTASGPFAGWYDEMANVIETKHPVTYTSVDGDERTEFKYISTITQESGSYQRALDLIHDITKREVTLDPDRYVVHPF